MKNQQSGFTLVELSIVIVIIGLLIGGILVGQSLYNWTKISSLNTQMTQIGIQVSQFKMRYKAIPGEYLRATTAWPAICNSAKGACYCNATGYSPGPAPNGIIDNNYDGEGAFAQLYAAGMMPMGRPQIYQDGTSPAGYWTCVANNMQQFAGMKTKLDNVYGVWNNWWTDTSGMSFGSNGNLAMSSMDAKTLDVKFDDGMPKTGLIKAYRVTGSYCDSGSSATDVYYDLDKSFCQIGIAIPSYFNGR